MENFFLILLLSLFLFFGYLLRANRCQLTGILKPFNVFISLYIVICSFLCAYLKEKDYVENSMFVIFFAGLGGGFFYWIRLKIIATKKKGTKNKCGKADLLKNSSEMNVEENDSCRMHHMPNQLQDKILGCLFGGAIGDGMGGPYEGGPPISSYAFPEHFYLSDDTQLTLATCEGIIDGVPNPEKIASSFLSWYRNGRVTGLGAATLKALRELSVGGHWALVGRKGEYAAGNGAAMRMAPLAFLKFENQRSLRQSIRDITWITHQHDEAYIGALAIVLAIQTSIRQEVPSAKSIAEEIPDSRVRDRLLQISKSPNTSSLKDISLTFGNSGFVADSVPLSIYAAERIIKYGDFENGLVDLISGGGDTDTIASMTGQIAGTYLGYKNLSKKLISKVEGKKTIEQIGINFSKVCLKC